MRSILILIAMLSYSVAQRIPEFKRIPWYNANQALPLMIGQDPRAILPKDTSLEAPAMFRPDGTIVVSGRDTSVLRFGSYIISDRVMRRYNMHVQADTTKSNIIGLVRESFDDYIDTVMSADAENFKSYTIVSAQLMQSKDEFYRGALFGVVISFAVMVVLVLIPKL